MPKDHSDIVQIACPTLLLVIPCSMRVCNLLEHFTVHIAQSI